MSAPTTTQRTVSWRDSSGSSLLSTGSDRPRTAGAVPGRPTSAVSARRPATALAAPLPAAPAPHMSVTEDKYLTLEVSWRSGWRAWRSELRS